MKNGIVLIKKGGVRSNSIESVCVQKYNKINREKL